MIAKLLTKLLPFDGTHVYYDGDKMTPGEASKGVQFGFLLPFALLIPLFIILAGVHGLVIAALWLAWGMLVFRIFSLLR